MSAAGLRMRRLLLFLFLCVVLYAVASSSRWRFMLPAVSLDSVSAFLQRYEEKISGIRSGKYQISLKLFLRNGVLLRETRLTNGRNGIGTNIPQDVHHLWVEALCLFCSFCLLSIGNAAICYLMCIGYGKIFAESIFLSIKALKHVDWYTPLKILRVLYALLHHVFISAAYLWSLIPPRHRYILLLLASPVVLIILLHIGLGKDRLICLLPVATTCGLYYYFLRMVPIDVSAKIACYMGDHMAEIWALCVLVRHYKLVFSPSWKIAPRSEVKVRSIQEMSFLLDLLLVNAIIGSGAMFPFIGPLLLRHLYLNHILFLTSLTVIANFLFLPSAGTDVTWSPLCRVKNVIIKGIDTVVHLTLGWPNIVSSRVGSSQNQWKGLNSLKKLARQLIPFLPYGDSQGSSIRGVEAILRWIKLLPYFLLLVLPRFVSFLYFEYLTLIAPSIRWTLLSNEASFKSQTGVVINFVLAKLMRFLVTLTTITFFPIKGLAAVAFAACMDAVMQCIDDVPTENIHIHVD